MCKQDPLRELEMEPGPTCVVFNIIIQQLTLCSPSVLASPHVKQGIGHVHGLRFVSRARLCALLSERFRWIAGCFLKHEHITQGPLHFSLCIRLLVSECLPMSHSTA